MQIEEIMLELRVQGVIAPYINTWKALSGVPHRINWIQKPFSKQ
ncbi:hypothetical protein [Paenibacillus terrigena]|nr:hypothetical protein [Paenibacillus terrigena]